MKLWNADIGTCSRRLRVTNELFPRNTNVFPAHVIDVPTYQSQGKYRAYVACLVNLVHRTSYKFWLSRLAEERDYIYLIPSEKNEANRLIVT